MSLPSSPAARVQGAPAGAGGPLLACTGLRFSWPGAATPTLDIDRFDVAAGETLFLHGPSGCGKSTLLTILAGVLQPQAGSVELLGTPWSALRSSRRDQRRADHVGYVFQQFNLLPYLSVLDNVLLPCRFSAVRARAAGDAQGEARRLLGHMALPAALWQREPTALSVGQQQRVAAARALIGRPALVIADEPTSALDEDLRERFVEVLLNACRDAGSALVFVSHDQRLAPRFERRVSLPALNRAAGATLAAGEEAAA
ncbi:ABC transporter ATP-binding protein [Aquincola sp. MAHUQ-54]|uniref:ABC transporter ATP-binding protein n=1 Tax=Aquincola agrisoli TaxID=3119538 RepID=A0AAW9Q8S5_9BURK